MNAIQAAVIVRQLLALGLTVYDCAAYLRAHPRAVAALIA